MVLNLDALPTGQLCECEDRILGAFHISLLPRRKNVSSKRNDIRGRGDRSRPYCLADSSGPLGDPGASHADLVRPPFSLGRFDRAMEFAFDLLNLTTGAFKVAKDECAR